MNSELVRNVRNLPLAEQIELIDLLWESVAEQGYEPPLTAEQGAELDRRLEAHRRNPGDVVSWDSIKEDILNRYSHR
jgi:putative addiction module component (TIGR02574 family)